MPVDSSDVTVGPHGFPSPPATTLVVHCLEQDLPDSDPLNCFVDCSLDLASVVAEVEAAAAGLAFVAVAVAVAVVAAAVDVVAGVVVAVVVAAASSVVAADAAFEGVAGAFVADTAGRFVHCVGDGSHLAFELSSAAVHGLELVPELGL